MGVEVPFGLLGVLYHRLQSFKVEDIKQDYETGKDGRTLVTFKVDFDRVASLEDSNKAHCGMTLLTLLCRKFYIAHCGNLEGNMTNNIPCAHSSILNTVTIALIGIFPFFINKLCY